MQSGRSWRILHRPGAPRLRHRPRRRSTPTSTTPATRASRKVTGITIGVIAVMLLIVYRSIVTVILRRF